MLNKKEATMKVGDRVEVVGDKLEAYPLPIGAKGTIKSVGIGVNRGQTHLDRVYWDDEDYNDSHEYTDCPYICNLKLITKGNDMEIEVGQVWECTSNNSYYYKKGETTAPKVMDNGEILTDKHRYDKTMFLSIFKLITNIKGDNKMEKAQGIKLKLGMWVTEEGCNHKGKILYISPQQTVYDCGGTHRTAKTEDLQIVFQLPTEPLNPKAPKKPKKKKAVAKKR